MFTALLRYIIRRRLIHQIVVKNCTTSAWAKTAATIILAGLVGAVAGGSTAGRVWRRSGAGLLARIE